MTFDRRLTLADLLGVDLEPQEAAFVKEYIKDFAQRRAAKAVGLHPDDGNDMLTRHAVKVALRHVITRELDVARIDLNWLLQELVENHYLARQDNKLSASNTALGLIGKHAQVDAFAAEKVHVTTGAEVADRLKKARQKKQAAAAEVSFL